MKNKSRIVLLRDAAGDDVVSAAAAGHDDTATGRDAATAGDDVWATATWYARRVGLRRGGAGGPNYRNASAQKTKVPSGRKYKEKKGAHTLDALAGYPPQYGHQFPPQRARGASRPLSLSLSRSDARA